MGQRLVIAIPAYNAEQTLEGVFARIPAEIDGHPVVVRPVGSVRAR